ncbi:MAG: GFA family protein [Pleurocapsa sp.]
MNELIKPSIYQGGCHCGTVRFQVLIDRDIVYDCNCSICRKKGFLHLIVPPENFTLLQGRDNLTSYRFNTKIAEHTFCSICGIHSFYRPCSHPDMIDVNIRTLNRDIISSFKVQPFDGRNWENNINKIQN